RRRRLEPRPTGTFRRLALLRQHPILSLEVTSGVGDGLAVAWMIDGFHADDDLHQPGIVLADVLDQRGLCIGPPRQAHRAGLCDRWRDSRKEKRDPPMHARSRWSLPYGGCAWSDDPGATRAVPHRSG